jgi:hypothetical protein
LYSFSVVFGIFFAFSAKPSRPLRSKNPRIQTLFKPQ